MTRPGRALPVLVAALAAVVVAALYVGRELLVPIVLAVLLNAIQYRRRGKASALTGGPPATPRQDAVRISDVAHASTAG